MSTSGAPARARSAAARDRRNFRFGVLNGAIYQTGEGFIDAHTVVPLFLSRLTSSNMLIGLASALNELGWLLPQLLVAPWAARFPRQVVLYRRAAICRGLALGTLAASIWPLRDQPAALLAVFFACYSVFTLGGGVGGVAFMEVVGRTIARARLGAYWSQRLFWGGLGAAAVGLVVREVLKLPDFGVRYALLFSLGAITVSLAYAMFSSVDEPPAPARVHESPRATLARGWTLARRMPGFRDLLMSRATLSVWLALVPFMVLFAVRDLGGGARAAGTFLFCRVAGYVLANLGWQPLSRRHGTRAVMRVASAMAPALALLAAAIALASPWRLGWISAGAAVLALEAIALLGGAAQSGMLVGYASLVLELAPVQGRQVFVSLANTCVGVTMLMPMLGGAFVDWVHAPAWFAVCAVLGTFGFRAAMRLPREGRVDERAAAALATGDEP